ncbi:carboxypeptidase M32 [Thermodesulforhabdus norvegica]|uniref:Metal-dependent carboxypeptidase n=1 Tax=Thermodesulforhabdus norvegica TaxID=39841 RepID=A0A1I4VS68_9BACT|nr:carboxypeptidase M32 [Thermodesulforhabdus norvegica]SFN04033.1 carboxypeptidase Taq [Thermodesulforhabdus norvegica]
MNAREAYEKLVKWSRELFLIESTMELLSWDQRCFIPEKGHSHRSEQIAYLSRLYHEKQRDPRVGEWLEIASTDSHEPDSAEYANMREWSRWHRRATKIPLELVEELAKTTSEAESVWEKARARSNWGLFEPYLEKIVRLKREEAEAAGYEKEPYDALIDLFEPSMTACEFHEISCSLLPFIEESIGLAMKKPNSIDDSFLFRYFPLKIQEEFGRFVAGRIGYDFKAGRLDVSAHPFTAYIGPGDVRITTRYNTGDFRTAFFAILHETGHALYDQGLKESHWGTPCGMYASLGFHEAQARFWENQIGRSKGFWKFFYPRLLKHFPILADVPLEKFWKALNVVKPSPIRVEADEVTYGLHIILRFRLERKLINGEMSVREVPEAWAQFMKTHLGISPSKEEEGALQDVHWSAGLFGYFPVYLLGNIYAAQIKEAMEKDLGPLEELCSRGKFFTILEWLDKNIYSKGRRHTPRELIAKITGRGIDIRPFCDYLRNKLELLYLGEGNP